MAKKIEEAAKENRTALALVPPTTLVAPNAISEAEKAFLAEAGDLPDDGPGKLPFITVNHSGEEFILPNGTTIDGSEGVCGFIIAHFTNRSWYEKPFDPKNKDKGPPDCKSMDCITPDANSPKKQADSCINCQWDKFGTAKVGNGKACREKIWLFIINPELGNMPHILILPPTALSVFYGGRFATSTKSGYLDQLKMKHKAWQIVWTKITAIKENRDDPHCTIGFQMGEQASSPVAIELAKINRQFLAIIKQSRNDAGPTSDVPF
jgi:hypothetical protein